MRHNWFNLFTVTILISPTACKQPSLTQTGSLIMFQNYLQTYSGCNFLSACLYIVHTLDIQVLTFEWLICMHSQFIVCIHENVSLCVNWWLRIEIMTGDSRQKNERPTLRWHKWTLEIYIIIIGRLYTCFNLREIAMSTMSIP